MVAHSSQKVLTNSYLLYEIFDHLSHNPESHAPAEGQLALARAARVGTTFSHPALAVKYTLVGEITPENWARFRSYADRIRHVRDDVIGHSTIDQSFCVSLSRQLRGQLLLPRIRSLSYSYIVDPSNTYLSVLLSPTLRNLSLALLYPPNEPIPNRITAVNMLISTVFSDSSMLTHLRMAFLGHSTPLRTLVGRLRHLQELDLPGSFVLSDAQTLRALADMDSLTTLLSIQVQFTTEMIGVSGFRSLQVLSISSMAANLSRFLACVQSPLRSLEIAGRMGSTPEWREEFATMIPKLESLTTLKIIHLSPEDQVLDDSRLAWFIHHLLSLRYLESFELRARTVDLHVDDAELERVAKAWPRLTRLSLLLSRQPSASSLASTLHPLVHFAKHCPSLSTALPPPD
ncbi:hypothetical protein C8Q74DRAFT_1371964 [Fomes fomentarius]|nr:hypothetical protein C8Q74DRAFT_1371964 [Fomes fomentarius]